MDFVQAKTLCMDMRFDAGHIAACQLAHAMNERSYITDAQYDNIMETLMAWEMPVAA